MKDFDSSQHAPFMMPGEVADAPIEVDGLQSVTVTFAIDALTYEEGVATFTQFMDAVTDQASEGYGILACVVELLPQPGDLAPARYVELTKSRDEQCQGVLHGRD